VIVLANQHDAPRSVSRLHRRAIAVHRRKGRLLHQHMFPCRERLQGEIKVEIRRHRYDNSIDLGVGQRRPIVVIAAYPAVAGAKGCGFGAIAARIARLDDAAEGLHMPAMDAGNEPAPEERYPYHLIQ